MPLADGGAGWAITPLREFIWLLGVMADGVASVVIALHGSS